MYESKASYLYVGNSVLTDSFSSCVCHVENVGYKVSATSLALQLLLYLEMHI